MSTDTVTVQELVALSVDQVHPSPDNVRSHVGDVTGLADSIRERGLLAPIVVQPIPADDDRDGWEIIAGHRRHAAHVLIGEDFIDAIVRPEGTDLAGATADRIVENVQRQDLSVADEARAYASLVNLGWSQRKIAGAVGVSQPHVSKRLKLAALPDDVLAAVDAGQARLEDALDLARLTERDQSRAAVVLEEARKPATYGPDKGKPYWDELAAAHHELEDLDDEDKRQKALTAAQAAADAGDGPPVFDPGPGVHKYQLHGVKGVWPLDRWEMREWKVTRARCAKDGTLAIAILAGGETVEVCTDRKRYRPKRTATKVKKRPWEVATERRREFIRDWLAADDHTPPASSDALVQLLVDVALPSMNGTQLQQITDAVGIEMPKSAGYRDRLEALNAALGPGIGQTKTARRIVEAAAIARTEDRMYGDYGTPDPHQVAHLRRLEAAGHTLHKAETDWLAKADDQEGANT